MPTRLFSKYMYKRETKQQSMATERYEHAPFHVLLSLLLLPVLFVQQIQMTKKEWKPNVINYRKQISSNYVLNDNHTCFTYSHLTTVNSLWISMLYGICELCTNDNHIHLLFIVKNISIEEYI
jgi:hypothetical protein